MTIILSVPGIMSVVSIHPARNGLSNRSQSFSSVSSLDDIPCHLAAQETVLSIEELRMQLNSCFTLVIAYVHYFYGIDR